MLWWAHAAVIDASMDLVKRLRRGRKTLHYGTDLSPRGPHFIIGSHQINWLTNIASFAHAREMRPGRPRVAFLFNSTSWSCCCFGITWITCLSTNWHIMQTCNYYGLPPISMGLAVDSTGDKICLIAFDNRFHMLDMKQIHHLVFLDSFCECPRKHPPIHMQWKNLG